MRFFQCLMVPLVLFQSAFSEEVPCEDLLSYSRSELVQWGILTNTDGFVYVSVDDAYIHELVKFIQSQGFEEPPYFGPGLVGAHITVIYPDEFIQYGIHEMPECGSIVHFEQVGCRIVYPPKMHQIAEVYLIEVDAPQLDQLRERYGLPQKLYPFHITIGVKRASP